jgi:hypothetical protein
VSGRAGMTHGQAVRFAAMAAAFADVGKTLPDVEIGKDSLVAVEEMAGQIEPALIPVAVRLAVAAALAEEVVARNGLGEMTDADLATTRRIAQLAVGADPTQLVNTAIAEARAWLSWPTVRHVIRVTAQALEGCEVVPGDYLQLVIESARAGAAFGPHQ